MINWKEHLYQAWLMAWSEYTERIRWKKAGQRGSGLPRVFYGHKHIPMGSEKASGGIIKCQDLQKSFPNHLKDPNLLYLVSSALPVNVQYIVRHALRCGGKLVWNQNGVAYPAWHGPGWEKTNAPMKRLMHSADYVVYQSRFCKEGADKYLGPFQGEYRILYNPVDTEIFVPATEKAASLRLLLTGSHHHFYRVQRVIEALALLIGEIPEVTLSIAGRYVWQTKQEEALQEAEELAKRLGVTDHVEFLGAYSQEQAVGLLQNAHILIHPKYNDPCPRLVVEGMACGLPVVYSASGGVPELVGEEAGVGINAPLDWQADHPPKAEDICQAVLQIWSDYTVYSQAARSRAVARFDLQFWLRQHKEIFEKVML